jgi:hypothetical protein
LCNLFPKCIEDDIIDPSKQHRFWYFKQNGDTK